MKSKKTNISTKSSNKMEFNILLNSKIFEGTRGHLIFFRFFVLILIFEGGLFVTLNS